jgi:hypothetical protein
VTVNVNEQRPPVTAKVYGPPDSCALSDTTLGPVALATAAPLESVTLSVNDEHFVNERRALIAPAPELIV